MDVKNKGADLGGNRCSQGHDYLTETSSAELAEIPVLFQPINHRIGNDVLLRRRGSSFDPALGHGAEKRRGNTSIAPMRQR